ncbi:MAG: AmmeMemoRadiSam system radical SAM enzyme [bacterium]|nr:AmmeMemoRadiSam system radical SAM enzyme [bacterium]
MDTTQDNNGYPAEYWRESENDSVVCELCPLSCAISDGKFGVCMLRSNSGGALVAEGYGRIAAIATDPIEKKPLYHFKPGTQILSVGPNGCNMRCRGCQNYTISQGRVPTDCVSPERLIALCEENESPGIAFTYSEPLVWFEYLRDAASLAKENGLYSVIVSNGYINPDPLDAVSLYLAAANIDVKSFKPEFYRDYCGASLQPVLDACKYLKERIPLEITYLLIPGLNDTEEEIEALVNWITDELGRDTPLHISAYFPHFEMTEPATPPHRLLFAKELAERELYYVYMGNVQGIGGADTHCPECANLLIERSGYSTRVVGLDGSCCGECGREIEVVV